MTLYLKMARGLFELGVFRELVVFKACPGNAIWMLKTVRFLKWE